MKEVWIRGYKIQYDEGNVRIIDSYKEDNIVEMYRVLDTFKEETGYKSKRSIGDWIREWRAHNRLYRLGLFKSHTKDTDLEENEKWYRLIVYSILGRF